MTARNYFTAGELACSCCNQIQMDSIFMDRLNSMREQAGFPFALTSAYRCPKHNNTVSTTGYDGPHTTGRAVDFPVAGAHVYWLIENAPQFGFTGIGLKQHGTHSRRYIHLDDLPATAKRPRPWVWTYR